MTMKYWLMKTEPDVFSFDDLKKRAKQTEPWDGVRNYQARNFMRDEMEVGDLILFYHSNCDLPAVVGVAEVAKEAYPDSTAWDPKSPYFDSKSTPDNPRWYRVDVKWKEDFKRIVSLQEIKAHPLLQEMKLVQKGQRLSVQPVEKKHFQLIYKMGT